jgi:hypothetical protein
MSNFKRRLPLLLPMALLTLGLAGCTWIEVNPKAVSWTEGEKAQTRQIGFKNKAPEEYTFKVLDADLNEGNLVKVKGAPETTCVAGAKVARRKDCIAILYIDQGQKWEARTVKFEVEGEVVDGRYAGEKGKVSASATTK